MHNARAQGDRLSPVGASLRCYYPRIGTQEALPVPSGKTDESLRLSGEKAGEERDSETGGQRNRIINN